MKRGNIMIQNTLAIQPNLSVLANVNQTQSPAEITKSFSTYLQNALQDINTQEEQVQTMETQFMLGKVDVDQLMIASESALLNVQLTTNIRNKVVEAYQEIMRMQM